ncbi:hypothetical protein ACMD2_13980 [Ananas comosus]|uniref:Uncharacterized protein n=1 Tax=Ananas comosus TaxID=4615 RepID=A0A199V133_ANACO|nr:hypothetical protein ACMD2_13980 [Ananas comosus]
MLVKYRSTTCLNPGDSERQHVLMKEQVLASALTRAKNNNIALFVAYYLLWLTTYCGRMFVAYYLLRHESPASPQHHNKDVLAANT